MENSLELRTYTKCKPGEEWASGKLLSFNHEKLAQGQLCWSHESIHESLLDIDEKDEKQLKVLEKQTTQMFKYVMKFMGDRPDKDKDKEPDQAGREVGDTQRQTGGRTLSCNSTAFIPLHLLRALLLGTLLATYRLISVPMLSPPETLVSFSLSLCLCQVLQMCITDPRLRDECYAQLMKQLTQNPNP